MKRLSRLLLLLTMLVMTSGSVKAVQGGQCGTCFWSLDDDGNMIIRPGSATGVEGTLADWGESTPWHPYCSSIKTVKFTGTVKAVTCYEMFYGCSSLTSIDFTGFDTNNVTNMNSMFMNCSSLTSLDISSFETRYVTDMGFMFSGCSKLETLNRPYFLTTNATNMQCMFRNCPKLTSIDLTYFDTSNVTDMKSMFYNCSGLKSLDISQFNTSNVTDMSAMFYGCKGLTGLDFSNFDTSNVTDMSYMFYECAGLASLDLSHFNTSKVTTLEWMFYNCTNLQSLNLTNFNMSSVTNMYNMFSYCSKLAKISSWAATPSSLKEGVFSSLPTKSACILEIEKSTKDTYASATGWNELTHYSLLYNIYSSGTCYWSLDTNGLLTVFPQNGVEGTLYDWQNYSNKVPWYRNIEGIKSVKFSGKVNAPSCNGMFNLCTNLTYADLTGLNTSNVTDMRYMFNGCTNLQTLNLTDFDMSSVTKMSEMFSKCNALEKVVSLAETPSTLKEGVFSTLPTKDTTCKLEISADYESAYSTATGWSELTNRSLITKQGTSGTCTWTINSDGLLTVSPIYGQEGTLNNWTNSYGAPWYSYRSRIKSAKFSGIVNASTCYCLFYDCTDLTTIDLTGFNTDNVTTMNSMFYNCSSLTSLDLSNFDTSKATDISGMFYKCSSLTSLNISSFKTGNVTTIKSMFNRCSGLTSLDLSNFDTSKVTDMSYVFKGCTNLKTLNLTGFNMTNVTSMTELFTNCNAIAKVISMAETPSTLKEGVFSTLPTKETCTLEIPTALEDAYASATGWNELTNYNTVTAQGTSGTCTWVIDNAGNMTISPINGVEGTLADWTSSYAAPWCNSTTSIKTVKFTGTVNAQTCYQMFGECSNLTSIDLTGLNTSNVTNMRSMFSNCSALTSLDLSSLNTSNVTTMEWMFYNCSKLTSLNVSNFNTSNVTSMSCMFRNCSGLTNLDLSSFNTSKVTTMDWMFYYCKALTSLDISNFNTSNVTNMSYMFCACSSLASLDVSKFVTDKVTNMAAIFSSCSSLTSLDVSKFNTSKVTTMRAMFSGCSSLTSLDVSKFDTSNVTDMCYLFNGCTNLKTLNLTGFNMTSVTSMDNMFTDCNALAKVISMDRTPSTLKEGTFSTLPTKETCKLEILSTSQYAYASATGWKELTNYRLIPGGVSGTCTWIIDNDGNMTISPTDGVEGTLGIWTSSSAVPWYIYRTSIKTVKFTGTVNAQTCYKMFEECSNLTSIDFTGFNTDNVPNMSYMFYGCSGLTSLDVSKLNTNNVTSMYCMFYNCSELTSLDASTFDTSNVSSMQNMFSGCSKLSLLVLPNLKTSKSLNIESLFKDCSGLTSLDLSHFDTSKVTSMNYMFSGCTGLTSLDVSMLNTNNVTSMYCMFYNCSKLTSLDVSKLNTSNVTNMACMFLDCSNLQSLDLTNFNMSSVTSMSDMFKNCSALNEITSKATTPSALKSGVFSTLPTKETCTLRVPGNSISAYQAATGWSELSNITGLIITITDGTPYAATEDMMCAKVTYNRTFSEKVVGNWQCLYVPFDVPVTAEILEDYDFAKLYMISYKDIDGDGEVSDSDPLAMLISKLSACNTLKANTPYFVRAKKAGTMSIEVENALLKAAANGTIDCSTTEHIYTLTGVYEPFCLNGYYTMNTSGSFSYYTEDKTLNPFRWYLDIEDRSGSKVEAKSIGIYVDGEDDTTGIVGISADENADAKAYSLDGRVVNNLESAPQGIYIMNGKKVIKK